ncbi:hypothetical protein D3C84_1289960 [compost metagenome]
MATIDNVIARGRWRDWAELRRAVLDDPGLLEKVKRVCRPRIADPYAQRYHFWWNYTKAHGRQMEESE